MAIVTAYDRLGVGVSIQAGDFSYFGDSLSYDGNAVIEQYDYDTVVIAATYENQTYGMVVLLDDIGSNYIFEIDSIVLTNSSLQPLLVLENVNIRLDIRDDFSEGFMATNFFAAADRFTGNRYADYIEAGAGRDWVSSLGGNDTILGGSGADTLLGGAGNDLIRGGTDSDRIQGGSGRDRLMGEAGADQFVFTATGDSAATATGCDVIVDFVRGIDRISLSSLDAFAPSGANDAFLWKGTTAFSSTTRGEVRYKLIDVSGSANDHTLIYVDTDQDSTAEMVLRLDGLHRLTAGDLLL